MAVVKVTSWGSRRLKVPRDACLSGDDRFEVMSKLKTPWRSYRASHFDQDTDEVWYVDWKIAPFVKLFFYLRHKCKPLLRRFSEFLLELRSVLYR